MDIQSQSSLGRRPAGYAALLTRYNLETIPNWHRSWVSNGGSHRVETAYGTTEETYPSVYWPGEGLGDHLEFALKYDGTNLAILAGIFQAAPEEELLAYVTSKPTGKYARQIWYLFEFLTNSVLPMEDVERGNYVDLLDGEKYYTCDPARKIRRQRINDNLLGPFEFCPIIRKTDTLRTFETADLSGRSREVVSTYSPELLRRALNYLYTKETKSSFEIERISPDSTRTERFVSLLKLAEKEDFCEKFRLIDLQNRIVDPRFRDDDYRSVQNYVGETVSWKQENVHYVCPKPEDIHVLMDGLVDSHRRMSESDIPAVIHAAAISYGFVFLHPFEDGNGRIHRFLIHNILARKEFAPEGVMFPVSASILKNPAEYDASLEAYSRELMPLIAYDLDEHGHMTVHNDTFHWYSYIDLTTQAEALYGFIERTIESELVQELDFLSRYDRTKHALQEIVDMPDSKIDLFIKFCLQNNGRLSERKRRSYFEMLTTDEITAMEQKVQNAYGDMPMG